MKQKEEFLKKVRYLLFAIFLCAPLAAMAQGDIVINEENFPDENFRNYLLEQDYGQDGIITEEEIEGIIYINVSEKNISSLKGIEYFTALEYLDCIDNQLTTLDVSKNTALIDLDCTNNQLTSLDISKNTALIYLYCYYNQLTVLDVSKNIMLKFFACAYNQLTSLDVSKNTALTSLSCYNNSLTSLDISTNTALTRLLCENNQLTSLDISKNTALTVLSCYANQLTSLDVSKNTALTSLRCDGNPLASLDVSKNTALTDLNCNLNQLMSLDVSKNTALTKLVCCDNQLTTLDVSKNTELTTLYCHNNPLTALDVSKNTALTTLYCYNNQLTSLDVSKNTALTTLYCYNNQLTSLDVSNNIALTTLHCYNNQIKGTSMDALISSLPQNKTSEEYYLYVLYHYGDGNVCTKKQVARAKEKGWIPYYLGYDGWQEYEGSDEGIAIDETNFPDENFRAYLLEQDYGQDGIITEEEIKEITNISLYQKGNIRSLKGIEHFVALTGLECSYNQLTELDVSQNTALTSLGCNGNQLTSLDISVNTALTWLGCGQNQLTSLDISRNTALTTLICGDNQLTELDISKNTALTHLDCDANQLTSLDVSKHTALTLLQCLVNPLKSLDISNNTELTGLYCLGNDLTTLDISKNTKLTWVICSFNQLSTLDVSNNTALTSLDCSGNQIKGAAMDVLINSLPQNTTGELYKFIVLHEYNEGNVCTKKQVAAAKAKGWLPYYRYNNGKEEEYEGSEDGIAIDETNFPDENFRAYLLEQDYGQDGIITEEEIKEITNIFLYQKGNIRSLKGIEYFVALTYLECSYNQLMELDVSQNTALRSLACNGNQLTKLDVSLNTALTSLGCGQNQLTSLDISQNTALTSLSCNSNQFTELDISKNTALRTLNCFDNQLTSLDVSKHTALTLLQCDSNPLKSLDISNNTELTGLYCLGNELTTLDISKNTKLTWVICSFNQLSTLDVSNNTALTSLDCSSNQIKGAAMDALIGSLPQNTTKELYKFIVVREYNEGNVCTKKQVAAAKAKGWLPYYRYNNGKEEEYEGSEDGIAIDETNFPDENFRTYLLEQDYGEDGLLTEEEIEKITKLHVYNMNISSLKGIEFFTALRVLNCGINQLTELDVSKNTALTELYCFYNQLTSLDVSKNTQLSSFICGGNQLTSLDVSKNTALRLLACYTNQLTSLDVSHNTALTELECYNNELTSLDISNNTILQKLGCYNNQLTALDVSNNSALTTLNCSENQLAALDVLKNIALTELYCDNNQLTALDVSKNTALTTLYCSNNQIKDSSMDALISSLPQNETNENCGLYVYNAQVDDGNVCTKAQVSAAKEKGWTPYYYINRNWEEYEGSDDNDTPETPGEDDVVMNEETFPDEGFRDILAELVGAKDGDVLTEEEIKEITSLDISEAGISDLTGIEYLTALTELVCEGNKLESLDVSKNTALTMIDCSRNQISGEAMDAFISSLPEKTAAVRATTNDAAEVYVLRVYDSTAADEGNVCTKAQVEAIKAKGWTPYYYNGSEWLEYTGYDDETTGIGWLGTGAGSVSVYNMAGQKVNLPANAKKGVYIVNGKKVVVK